MEVEEGVAATTKAVENQAEVVAGIEDATTVARTTTTTVAIGCQPPSVGTAGRQDIYRKTARSLRRTTVVKGIMSRLTQA